MEILLTALGPTLRLLLRLAPVMFLSLFGAEILLQLGFMRRLEPLGKPLVRLARPDGRRTGDRSPGRRGSAGPGIRPVSDVFAEVLQLNLAKARTPW